MNLGALIGLVLGFVILGSAAAIGAADAGVSVGLLADPMSLAIVVGGAMAATAIAFPLPDLIGALGGFTKVFKGKDFTMSKVTIEVEEGAMEVLDELIHSLYADKAQWKINGGDFYHEDGGYSGDTNRVIKAKKVAKSFGLYPYNLKEVRNP